MLVDPATPKARTREIGVLRCEIGVLRCIGARARDIRRIFATEGVVLALLIMLLPIRRAVRFRPGDALRYA